MSDTQYAENRALRAALRDIGTALGDRDDRENLLGALAVAHGIDRAREIMTDLDALIALGGAP